MERRWVALGDKLADWAVLDWMDKMGFGVCVENIRIDKQLVKER